jgi:hypothetical protein
MQSGIWGLGRIADPGPLFVGPGAGRRFVRRTICEAFAGQIAGGGARFSLPLRGLIMQFSWSTPTDSLALDKAICYK